MVRYNIERVKEETINFCKRPIPVAAIEIVRYLKRKVPGFYRKTPAKKIVGKFRGVVLAPLVEDGFIVEYKPEDPVWYKVRALVSRFQTKKKPRKVSAFYQVNFLYVGGETYPRVDKLPQPEKELNLDLVVFLSKFEKEKMGVWDLINLLLCGGEREYQEKLRIYLYKLPFDYNEIEILEKVLDYAPDFKLEGFPLAPDINSAFSFLEKLSGKGLK